jgi:hypothetical protein
LSNPWPILPTFYEQLLHQFPCAQKYLKFSRDKLFIYFCYEKTAQKMLVIFKHSVTIHRREKSCSFDFRTKKATQKNVGEIDTLSPFAAGDD